MCERPNVVIILAKCRKSKDTFGIRIEERFPSKWLADWAFPIGDKKAKKEGYGQSEIRGTFGLDPAYPGCPHCHAPGFFKCGCENIGCWDGETRIVTCPWCGAKIELTEDIKSINTNKDR